MKLFTAIAAVAILSAEAVNAQELGPMFDTEPRGQKWQSVDPAASKEDILQALSAAGWESGMVIEQLSAAESFELYSRAAAPGVVSYLAVPLNGVGGPIEFSSPRLGGDMQQVFWGNAPTSDEIRQEIVDGMQAAIDALCAMRARPNSIRAQASAFGVVEVEATWEAAEVCDG